MYIFVISYKCIYAKAIQIIITTFLNDDEEEILNSDWSKY